MLRQRTRTLQGVMALADAVATATAFFAAYYGAGVLVQDTLSTALKVLPVTRYLWLLYASVPAWWVLFGVFGCYDFSPIERIRELLWRMGPPLLVGALAIGAAVFFSKELVFSRRVVGAFLVGNVALLVVGRAVTVSAATAVNRATGRMRRILVVGAGERAREFGTEVGEAGWGLELAGYVGQPEGEAGADVLGTVDDLPRILDEGTIDDVVVASAQDLAGLQRVIRVCEEVGVCIHIPARFFNATLSRPHVEVFRNIPMLTFSTTPYSPLALGAKRGLDVVLGLVLLVAASPLMAVLAVIVKAGSRGPAVFKQRRCGLYGREFTLYKFRSMVLGSETRQAEFEAANEMDGPAFKMQDDPRVTRFGRWLRRHSLDELPQLWNVVNGDMSLIGPRPPLPDEVKQYERWQRRRLSMRPGLACIWEVTDRNTATFDRWMEYDLRYIDNWSLWLDLKIAVRIVPAVIMGTGV